MTFVSYAQNFEDVILHRALSGVEKGFYIDVGAQDPATDSVTKAFYDAGWRGINIEPVNEWYERLIKDRPNDINLRVAIGASDSEVNFNEVVGTGLSTIDESMAKSHAERGYQIKNYKVPVTTLSAVCEQYPSPVIHFLKIDVEGAEKSVLEGFDLKKIRPWIILVESTFPISQIERFKEWEFILLGADYEFVYFDGLNRFYVAKEHQEIGKALAIPPNVFDNFVLSSTNSHLLRNQIEPVQASSSSIHQLQQLLVSTRQLTGTLDQQLNNFIGNAITKAITEIEWLYDKQEELQIQNETMLAESTQREALLRDKEEAITWLDNEWKATKLIVENLQQSKQKWLLQSERLEKQLHNVFNSYSWRITWPLRKLLQFFLWLFSLSTRFLSWLAYPLKFLVRWLLLNVNSFVLKRPRLQVRAQNWLDRHPKITARLQQLKQVDGSLGLPQATTPELPQPELMAEHNEASILEGSLSDLTDSARLIYHELQASINDNRKKV